MIHRRSFDDDGPRSTESRGGQGQTSASSALLCKSSLTLVGQIVLAKQIHRFAISTDYTSSAEEWTSKIFFESEFAGSGGQVGTAVAGSAGSSSNLAHPALMYIARIPLLSLQMMIASNVLARRESHR
jgi:hypothetical protein